MRPTPELTPPAGLLDKKLAEEPIELPGSPFWEIARTFGRDELIALGINTGGTAGLSAVTGDPLLLTFVGPVLEKTGFFVHSTKEAVDVYKTTPHENRKPLHHYAEDAIKNGLPNFWRDLVGHDPLYTASMFYGLHITPQTPAWILSTVAFTGAVGVVAAGEVALKETAYQGQVQRLKHADFSRQQHLESKFIIKNDDPEKVLGELVEEFSVGDIQKDRYHDRYFETSLRPYNAREPMFRLRQRTAADGGTRLSQTAQVVYTRASEVARRNPSQFRYYPVAKDKFRRSFDGEMPESIDAIEDPRLKKTLQRLVNGTRYHDVVFARDYARDPGRMLISVDKLDTTAIDPYTVVEIKAYRNRRDAVQEMVTVMRHIMYKYDVQQTTHSKRVLTSLNSS